MMRISRDCFNNQILYPPALDPLHQGLHNTGGDAVESEITDGHVAPRLRVPWRLPAPRVLTCPHALPLSSGLTLSSFTPSQLHRPLCCSANSQGPASGPWHRSFPLRGLLCPQSSTRLIPLFLRVHLNPDVTSPEGLP